jgi:hypothetical protein
MLDAAIALAVEISSKSPVAVQSTKINLLYSRDHPVDQALDYMVSAASTNHSPPCARSDQSRPGPRGGGGAHSASSSDWCVASLSPPPFPRPPGT